MWDISTSGADGAIPITGVLDTGNGYEPNSAGGAYNGGSWALNTPITIRPYWIGGMSKIRPGTPAVFRPRIRINRGLNDFGISRMVTQRRSTRLLVSNLRLKSTSELHPFRGLFAVVIRVSNL